VVRDSWWAGADEVLGRLRKVADGAGLMAEVEPSLTVQSGVPEMLVNEAGSRLLQASLERLGPSRSRPRSSSSPASCKGPAA
jgi:aminobenzoyl-glutamate utilization protein B